MCFVFKTKVILEKGRNTLSYFIKIDVRMTLFPVVHRVLILIFITSIAIGLGGGSNENSKCVNYMSSLGKCESSDLSLSLFLVCFQSSYVLLFFSFLPHTFFFLSFSFWLFSLSLFFFFFLGGGEGNHPTALWQSGRY